MNQLISADEAIKHFRKASSAENTKAAYASDWRIFEAFCEDRVLASLPCEPKTLEMFCVEMVSAGLKTATVLRRVATISAVHHRAFLNSPSEDPGFRKTLRGIRREHGGDATPKRPLSVDHLRLIGEAYSSSEKLRDKRDLAMILIGWCGAFRQSEIVALNVDDIESTPGGLKICVRRSKTDQEGVGAFVGIPESKAPEVCPVRALFRYLTAAKIDSGPVFRRLGRWELEIKERLAPDGVNAAVKRAIAAIDEVPAPYGGHSLRSGLATSAAAKGATLQEIASHGRWRSIETVLKNYIRPATLFTDRNAAKLAGL